jgi:hypothetical protein
MLPRPPAAAHSGRRSNRSPRARHAIRIGPAALAATCSIRSSIAGSAQWMSSKTTTSGRRRAIASKSRRTAHWTSASVALARLKPAAAATRDATTSGCASSARRPSIAWTPLSPARSFTISISGQ